jgi:NDP-sugar pyrophosphorylase family protein
MRGLILSAGLGERLRPLTLKRAKPAVEFLNMPMLAFPYHWLDSVGLTDVVFNTHYLPDSVRHAAMHVVKPTTNLHFTHEDAILGSGGGIWNARFHLQQGDVFAVANGDGVVVFEEADVIQRMLAFHRAQGALATLLVCPLDGVGTRIPGVWQSAQGEVTNFGKAPEKSGLECLHYASFMFISKRVWTYMPEGSSNILYDVFTSAIAQGEKVYGFRVDKMRWFETGNVADYLSATRTCLEFLRADKGFGRGLRAMLERFVPDHKAQSDLARRWLIADSARLKNANLQGFSVIGADADATDCALEDCVVLPQARVPAAKTYRGEVLI